MSNKESISHQTNWNTFCSDISVSIHTPIVYKPYENFEKCEKYEIVYLTGKITYLSLTILFLDILLLSPPACHLEVELVQNITPTCPSTGFLSFHDISPYRRSFPLASALNPALAYPFGRAREVLLPLFW